jgi:N-acetylglucosamine kinase-like BadF-type ATPase
VYNVTQRGLKVIFLGIDQGGSKTIAVLFDREGNLISIGTGYGACFYYDGLPFAMEAIRQAVKEALTNGNCRMDEIESVTAGIAGINWQEEERMVHEALRDALQHPIVKVYNDCLIALRAGTDNGDCAVLCAGTRFNAAIRNRDGVQKVYNSYVDRLDQGGEGLAERIFRAVFDAEIGISPPTRLTEKVLSFFGRDSVETLLYDLPRNKLERSPKDMTFLLFELADESDEAANSIVQDFAKRICSYVTAGIAGLGMVEYEMDVVLTGGVFKTRSLLLLDTIRSEIHKVAPRARIVSARYEPVIGAVKMGLDTIYGGEIPAKVLDNCHMSATNFLLTRNVEHH